MKKILLLLIPVFFLFLPLYSQDVAVNDEELAASIESPSDDGLAVDEDAGEQAEPEMPIVKDHTVFTGLVNIRAGYSFLSLKAANDFLKSYGEYAVSSGAAITSEQKMEGAAAASMDIAFLPIAQLPLSPGIRISYLNCNAGHTQSSLAGSTEKYSLASTVVQLLAGTSYELILKEIPLSFIADAYLGYAFAGGMLIREIPSLKEEAMFGGGGFAGDFGIKANYRLLDALSAGISVSYTLSNAGEMSYSADADIGTESLKKGDKVVNFFDGNSAMIFDYSGVVIGLNLNMLY